MSCPPSRIRYDLINEVRKTISQLGKNYNVRTDSAINNKVQLMIVDFYKDNSNAIKAANSFKRSIYKAYGVDVEVVPNAYKESVIVNIPIHPEIIEQVNIVVNTGKVNTFKTASQIDIELSNEMLLEQELNEDRELKINRIQERKPIKPGVAELFESNPKLSNSVYESLGFDKQINEIADTKKVDEFIKKYKDALPNIKDGKTLISHLQTLSNRNTGTTKQFADLIIELSKSNKGLEKLLNNPNLYAKPNGVGDEGAFHWSLFSNLSVNKIVLELDHFKINTYDDVFLHELIHNLTTQFIVKDSDLFNQNFYNKVKELYSVFDNYLENNKKVNEPLLKSTKEDIKNLKEVLRYFTQLPSDAIQHELIFGKIGSISTIKGAKLDFKSLENRSKQDVLKELERIISFKESRLQEIEKGDKDYYYFNSKTFKQENVLSEFLATFINDVNFREQLKNIEYKNKKSLFQKIIDLISEFLGLTENDSLYNEFVITLANFINSNDYSAIAGQTQKIAYQNRINLLEQQKQKAQQLYSQYLDTIGVTDIGYHHSESDLESFTTFSEGYFPKELKKKGTHYKEADDIVFFVRKPLTEEFMSKRKFIGTWGLKIPNTLQFNAGKKVGEGVHPGIDEGIRNAVNGNYDAVDFGRIRDNKTWSEVVAITNPKNAVKLGSKQDIEGFKEFVGQGDNIDNSIIEDLKNNGDIKTKCD